MADDSDIKYEKDRLEAGNAKYLASRSPSPRRGSNESSPTRSLYDEDLDAVANTPKEILNCYNSRTGFNFQIESVDATYHYYVDNSFFTRRKPDVTLHQRTEKLGPVIGVCKWSTSFPKTVLFGIGDYLNDEGSVSWNSMQTESFFKTGYQWRTELPNETSKSFTWKRSHKNDDPDVNRLSRKNFKLIDDAMGEIVVLFASNRFKDWKKLSKFKIMADHGEELRLKAVLQAWL